MSCNPRVRECMGAIRECERGAELDDRVVALFDSVVAAESAGADRSEAVFLAAAFCAAVYGADRTVVGGSSSLSGEVIPDRSDADFEPALRSILGRMRSLGSALDLSVEAGGVAFTGMNYIVNYICYIFHILTFRRHARHELLKVNMNSVILQKDHITSG